MQSVLATYDWPTYRDDADLIPVTVYHTDLDFLQSLRPIRGGDHSFIASSMFFQMLRLTPCTLPIDRQEVFTGYAGAYSMLRTYPFLHRAYAAVPELFDNLRVILDDIHDKYDKIDDIDHIYNFLTQPENSYIIAAMHDAYRIMGRLFKKEDPVLTEKAYKVIDPNGPPRMLAPMPVPEDVLRHGDIGAM